MVLTQIDGFRILTRNSAVAAQENLSLGETLVIFEKKSSERSIVENVGAQWGAEIECNARRRSRAASAPAANRQTSCALCVWRVCGDLAR